MERGGGLRMALTTREAGKTKKKNKQKKPASTGMDKGGGAWWHASMTLEPDTRESQI